MAKKLKRCPKCGRIKWSWFDGEEKLPERCEQEDDIVCFMVQVKNLKKKIEKLEKDNKIMEVFIEMLCTKIPLENQAKCIAPNSHAGKGWDKIK